MGCTGARNLAFGWVMGFVLVVNAGALQGNLGSGSSGISQSKQISPNGLRDEGPRLITALIEVWLRSSFHQTGDSKNGGLSFYSVGEETVTEEIDDARCRISYQTPFIFVE